MSVAEVPVNWVDLLDPTAEELVAAWPGRLDAATLEALCSTADFEDLPRPRFATLGGSVVGVFLLPVLLSAQDRLYHQEINLVLTSDAILTVRKTPRDQDGSLSGDPPYDIAEVASSAGMATLPASTLRSETIRMLEPVSTAFSASAHREARRASTPSLPQASG